MITETPWVGDDPAGQWARLRADHPRSGRWPVLLTTDEHRPWSTTAPASTPAPDDAATLLARWWTRYADDPAITAPFGPDWPGPAPTPEAAGDPDTAADGVAADLLHHYPSLRLGLVPAERSADVPVVAGWTGAAHHTRDTAEVSTVLRDWEDRFGARVVALGPGDLVLGVAAPPTTRAEALAVAAEHFAFCPDNVWQGDARLSSYADRLVADGHRWSFWWE
ncbi:DUF4253 domain-containing protein [Saccharothrix sp. NPDC042600]|uniref:DUF4253 domain-containing protein n=1 Tax=Saccharothrix TaxID=2071 RepID=UPI0033E40739|nr:DUF4253 domain-containing protein [Saccharothrix mutabilis subsp. capreolus]